MANTTRRPYRKVTLKLGAKETEVSYMSRNIALLMKDSLNDIGVSIGTKDLYLDVKESKSTTESQEESSGSKDKPAK